MTRPYRVVIADDEKPVAVGLQNQLESLGYDVVAVVNDGQRAIEMCRRTLPDAVFLDIEMPGLDGLSAARQIAVDPGTPVIILTAHGHPNLIDQAVEDGVISYLLKPATNPSLHAAVQVAVARARELKALQDDVDELRIDAPRAEADRTGQGHPHVSSPSERERRVPALATSEPGSANPDGQVGRIDHPDRRIARGAGPGQRPDGQTGSPTFRAVSRGIMFDVDSVARYSCRYLEGSAPECRGPALSS